MVFISDPFLNERGNQNLFSESKSTKTTDIFTANMPKKKSMSI